MKVIVTCGPSYEPIDQVRRLTNFSTGELGIHLSNQLARAGFEVFCLKGSGATHPGPGEQCHLSLFDTNDDSLTVQFFWFVRFSLEIAIAPNHAA